MSVDLEMYKLQKTIEETIRTLGGYWVPLSGLARVLEELGELGELILNNDFSSEFETELIDVLVITICVANQYCARLAYPDEVLSAKMSLMDTKDIYLSLARDCGEFARILNSYEGNKKLKPTENPTTVENQASKIVFDIFSLAGKYQIDIVNSVQKTMEKIKKRDAGRFDTLFDPVLAKSRDEYILKYHGNSKFWGLRDSIANNLVQDLENNQDALNRFLKFGKIEGIDFLVLKIDSKDYNYSLDNSKYQELVELEKQQEFVLIRSV
jgi:NTP pyrophosphatase (non-canonical NTP hydrolase)